MVPEVGDVISQFCKIRISVLMIKLIIFMQVYGYHKIMHAFCPPQTKSPEFHIVCEIMESPFDT